MLDALRRGFAGRSIAMLADGLNASESELRAQGAAPGSGLPDDALTNVGILRRDVARLERQWHAHVDVAFSGWPGGAGAVPGQGYSLVSDGELQAQLIGQPAIEALERRFVDVLDTIGSRLWSLAIALGGAGRPPNPFAPRVLVEATLATLPPDTCDPALRMRLVRHYERLCGERLGDVYAWLNTQLAEAGYAMTSASDQAVLVAQPAAGVRGSPAAWGHDNALAPTQSSWRGKAGGGGRVAGEGDHGNALRALVRAARTTQVPAGGASRRALSDQEFLSVLSLLQGNETPRQPATVAGPIGAHLCRALLRGAADLGMSPDTTTLSEPQRDALEMVGILFDGLRRNAHLDPAADARLARLAYPYLRLALVDPVLFDADRGGAPALALLDGLLDAWDGNDAGAEADAGLHAIADDVADDIANEYHGDPAVLHRAHAGLQSRLEPLRRRAEIAERRAWQSVLGRERLDAARAEADRQLARRTGGRRVLPTVAAFLGEQWRQSLVHAWLREGPESARFRAAVALGDAVLDVDARAAQALGSAVAEGLLALEQPLRDCHVACGLDESGANSLLASLVAELARPDAPRAEAVFTPLAGEVAAVADRGDAGSPAPPLETGQVLLEAAPGAVRWLRLAWVSPMSGRLLLVNRQGQRQALLDASAVRAALDAGRLVPRAAAGAVDAVLRPLYDAAGP